MTTGTQQQPPSIKRRKMDTIYLGAIGQDDGQPTAAIETDVRPQTSTTGATNFASFHRAMTAGHKNDAGPRLSETRLSHGADPKSSFGAVAENSYGGDFSMDSDVFALVAARNTHRTSTTLDSESIKVPQITKDVRIVPRKVQLAASGQRGDGTKENIVAPPSEIAKDLVVELQMRNSCPVNSVCASTSAPHASGLKCTRVAGRGEPIRNLWEVLLLGPVTILEANHDWTLAACGNRQLSVIRTLTGKLQRTLRFPSLIAILVLHGGVALIMLADATMSTWDLNTSKSIVQTSLSAALRSTTDARILHCAVSDNGVPMILLNNDECLVYSKSMNAWLNVGVGVDPISRYIAPLQHIVHEVSNGLLALLAKQKNVQIAKSTLDDAISASCEETQFEALLAACQTVESWAELRLIFSVYARNLLKRGKRTKLVEALDDLANSNEPTVLEDVLQQLKPVFSEYGTSYENLKREDDNVKINLSFID